jgi:hypothetical protein
MLVDTAWSVVGAAYLGEMVGSATAKGRWMGAASSNSNRELGNHASSLPGGDGMGTSCVEAAKMTEMDVSRLVDRLLIYGFRVSTIYKHTDQLVSNGPCSLRERKTVFEAHGFRPEERKTLAEIVEILEQEGFRIVSAEQHCDPNNRVEWDGQISLGVINSWLKLTLLEVEKV